MTGSNVYSAAAPTPAAQPAAPAPKATPAPATVVKTSKPTNATINVAASTLGDTPVTIGGKTVKASSLLGVTQVAVGFVSAFSPAPRKGGSDHNRSNNYDHGTGAGSQNAANSNSAHGLGGGNHVGGGSAQSGSRNVGQW